MTIPMDAPIVLDGEFLQVRARLLQLAATFDRIQRADGAVDDDPRMDQVRQSLQVLSSRSEDRAEQIQMIFSLPYDDTWRENYFPAAP